MIAVPKADFTFSSNWSTEITRQTIESEPDSNIKISSANDPLRHRVKTGETVYSIARAYNVSVNSIATWNGLGPDLEIKTGREIIIPAAVSSLDIEKDPISEPIQTTEKNESDGMNAQQAQDSTLEVEEPKQSSAEEEKSGMPQ